MISLHLNQFVPLNTLNLHTLTTSIKPHPFIIKTNFFQMHTPLDKILTRHFYIVNHYYEIHSIVFSFHMVYIGLRLEQEVPKMARGRSSFKMGTVEMMVLFLLDKSDLYGYQLTTLIKKLSGGNVEVNESTLYPTMYKLLQNNYISDREEQIGKRRIRVYYHLEDAGRARLSDLLDDYSQITAGIAKLLSCTKADIMQEGETDE